MTKLTVFLSGGTFTNWQDKIIAVFPDITFIDPRTHNLKDEQAYTEWDLAGVDRADIVFGYLEKDNPSGAGLATEMAWGKKGGKYVIFAEEDGHPKTRYFGMTRQLSDTFFKGPDALNMAIDHLGTYLKEYNLSNQSEISLGM